MDADKTTGGTFSVTGERQYTFVILVRPMSETQVSVSLQFSSGKINIQPNLLVDIGKEATTTIDKIRLKLLVRKVEGPKESELVASRE